MKRLFFLLAVGSLFLFASCSYEDVEVTNFSNYSVKKANKEGFDLHLDLTVNNPNNYKMTMKWARMDVYLNDKYIGETRIEQPITLDKNSENEYPVVLHTSYDEAFQGNILNLLGSAIFGKGIRLKVEGEMKGSIFLFSKKYPIEHSENLNLSDLEF